MKVEVSKSQKIRDYLKSVKGSDANPKAVSTALKAKGVVVTPGLVGVVKSKMGSKNKKKKVIKPKARRKVKARQAKIANPHLGLIMAKDFLNSAGGLKQAKNLLDVVNRLIS